MDESTLTILLVQFLALSVFVTVIVALIALKFRERYRRLMRDHVRLKKSQGRKPKAPARAPVVVDEGQGGSDNWKGLQEQALDRYRKTTGKTLGDYTQSDPFSARVASIRYHYLQAEEKAANQSSDHGRWQVLEKALAELVTTLLQNARPVKANEPDKTSLMRERLRALQSVESDNRQLRAKAAAYGEKVERLKGYRQQYSNIVARLNSGEKVDLASALDTLDSAGAAYQQSVRHITEHVTREPGQSLYADKQPILRAVEQLHEGTDDARRHLDEVRRSVSESKAYTTQRELLETLRRNNSVQRHTILDLRHEIKCLQRAMVDEGGAEGDTSALARLLQESEDCIATLESEVDNLYSQVQQQQSAELAAADSDITSILVDFALAVVDANSEKALFNLLLDTLAQLNIPFAVRMKFDGEIALANRTKMADVRVKALLERWATEGPGTEAGFAVVYARAQLQLLIESLGPLSISAEHMHSFLETMYSLIQLQLEHLSDVDAMQSQHQQMLDVAERVRSGVTTIEIQYAYGTEETKRLVDNLIVEMRQLVSIAEMDREMGEVFEAAITEAKQRFAVLYEAGSAVDEEIERLSEALDALQK